MNQKIPTPLYNNGQTGWESVVSQDGTFTFVTHGEMEHAMKKLTEQYIKEEDMLPQAAANKAFFNLLLTDAWPDHLKKESERQYPGAAAFTIDFIEYPEPEAPEDSDEDILNRLDQLKTYSDGQFNAAAPGSAQERQWLMCHLAVIEKIYRVREVIALESHDISHDILRYVTGAIDRNRKKAETPPEKPV